MRKGGEDEHTEECQYSDRNGDLLCWPLFLRGAKLLAALKQRRVFERKIYSDHIHRGHKDHDKDPGLPVVERPRRKEKQYPQCDSADKKCTQCLSDELVHDILFLLWLSVNRIGEFVGPPTGA